MRFLRSKKLLALAVAVITAGIAAAVAIPAVVSTNVINDTSTVHFQVVRRVAEGFDSGWHIHPGLAIVQVQEGSVDIYQGSCTPRKLGPGDTYIEVPHEAVRAIATGHFAWTTTFIITGGNPLQIPLASYSPANANPCPSVP
jgi:hypothetical protein